MARMYDPDGWMLTDDNELIAVARDASYKEAVRHGKPMISLLVAELAPPPVFYSVNYPHHDPMSKNTHGPSVYVTNPRKRNHTGMCPKTRRNRACKLLSREKKRHPKYVYQHLSPLCEEVEPENTIPKKKNETPVTRDDTFSLRIRIPNCQEDKCESVNLVSDDYEDIAEENNFWNEYWKGEYCVYRD